MVPQLLSSLELESLRHCPRLRIVFIIEPSDVSRSVEDRTDTASNAHDCSGIINPLESINHCTSVIREKLQEFVSPSGPDSVDREKRLDLSFEVRRREEHVFCGEDGMEMPYDVKSMRKQYRRRP